MLARSAQHLAALLCLALASAAEAQNENEAAPEKGAAERELPWSFHAPRPAAAPAVRDARWVRDELDRYVLAELEREGLRPSAPADARTLVKRVHLDLTGLLPTPEQVESFAADPSAARYEALVDDLLASERCAEHLARHWLDGARYGDTHGLHLDNYREMWPYRDWVLSAFRENLRYDRFGAAQIAGDQLADGGLAEQVATGFLRCHVTTGEGGSIEDEVAVRNLVDRTSTFGTVFLGLTLGCATCHDHKFDPLSTRDFYALAAFFDNLDGSPLDGNVKDHAPFVRVPSPSQLERARELEAEAAQLEVEIAATLRGITYEEPAAEAERARAPRTTTAWIDDDLPPGAFVEGPAFVFEASGTAPVRSGRCAIRLRARELEQFVLRRADTQLRVGAGDLLCAWVWIDPERPPREIMLQWHDGGALEWNHRAFWGEDLIPWGEPGTSSRRRLGDLPRAGEWVRLEVPAQEVGFAPGSVVHGLAITHWDGVATWDALGIESTQVQSAEDRVWIDDEAPAGASLQGDGERWQWIDAAEGPVRSGARSLRRRARGLSQDFFTGAREPLLLHEGDRLFAYVHLDPQDPPRSVQIQLHDGNGWDHRARWGEPAHGPGRANGADFVAGPLPPLGRWVRLEVSLAEVGLAAGRRIDGWAFTQVGGTVCWDGAGVHTWVHPDPRLARSLEAWEAFAPSDGQLAADLRAIAARPRAERSDEEQQRLREHYLRHVHGPSRALFAPLEARAQQNAQARAANEAAQPTTLVMKERAELQPTYVLKRGQYDQRGEALARATPAALPAFGAELPRDRAGLAAWLFDPAHPLTARVQVNRLWQIVFGVGLVRTSEDFGNQGEAPTHRELLDHLALSYIASGWDTRALLRRFALSATYRQSSAASAEELARDPQNRRLARAHRFRVDAEVLRDQALQVAGLLVERFGGPSVKPPQPPGLWEAVAYVGSNTMNFVADEGSDKVHRRTLYTFLKRTAPAPQLGIFDAPSRELCVVRRERTNTPLQALLLLNEAQFFEAAGALARRVLAELPESDDAARTARLFALVTTRPADAFERERLRAYLDFERRRTSDELAAWTRLANLVLNLDELLVRR
jgi:hypothetical protein